MRKPLRSNPMKTAVRARASIPAPVEGWDAASPLADMPERRAVILDNAVPRAGYVEYRRGYRQHAILGGTDPVETLMTWDGGSGSKLFAAAGTSIFDVTANGTASAVASVSITSARWQTTNFGNSGGQFLLAVNGADPGLRYDGTTWVTCSIIATTAISSVTGLTISSADVDLIMTHKRRQWFGSSDSLFVWYTATDAVAGPCGLLDLGPVLGEGGALTAMGSWSLDGGAGPEDYAVFVTNKGEIAIYAGVDPDDATDWRLIGRFKVGKPLGKRCLVKYGGDLILTCSDGALPLSQLVATNFTKPQEVAITARIAPRFSQAAQDYGDNFGWQAWNYQAGSLLIFNVPVQQLAQSQQYVQSLVTGGWCRFTGINVWCWGGLGDGLYCGGDGYVYQADVGAVDGAVLDVSDDSYSGGLPITVEVKPAFNYLRTRGVLKHVTLVRPVLTLSNNVNTRPAIIVDVDFGNQTPTAVPVATSSGAGRWDAGLWNQAVWGGQDEVIFEWTGANALGTAITPHMQHVISNTENITGRVISFDLNFNIGTGL